MYVCLYDYVCTCSCILDRGKVVMYVCMYVCMYVKGSLYIFVVWTCMRMYVYITTCVRVRVCVSVVR